MKLFEVSPKELAKELAEEILSMDKDAMFAELVECGFLNDSIIFDKEDDYDFSQPITIDKYRLNNIDYKYLEGAA